MPSDIEKGGFLQQKAPASRRCSLLLPRRKLPILLFTLIALVTLSIFFFDGLAQKSGSGLRYIKDSMLSPPPPAEISISPPPALSAAAVPIEPFSPHLTKKPSAALIEWAKTNGHPLVEGSELLSDPRREPTTEEKVLVFLQAIKDEAWEVPSNWHSLLLPKTATELAQSITDTSKSSGAAADAGMYLQSPAEWLDLHRSNNQITVFSKSYCPYSKAAKALLSSMKASFKVVEVDLRHDHDRLQAALAAITGHKTFPTIFISGTLLGGNDDLQSLHKNGSLEGLLRGANGLD